MGYEDQPTDDAVELPWYAGEAPSELRALHLVVAWVIGEPDRVGQSALIDRRCQFGRAGDFESTGPLPPLEWRELRPGVALGAPAFTTPGISRRQLELTPLGPDLLGVRSVGRRQLFHNGAPVAECRAQPGDTLMLQSNAVFLVASFPPTLAPRARYPEPDFAFGDPDPDGFVGESAAAWALREKIAAAAATRDHVLFTGASGAGKELAAHMLHRLSARGDGPFVARSAATFPEGLVDSELFGSARNYPNPGSAEREGLIGAADGGTLLLDEIGELPEAAQARLLRVLDAGGEYHRLGESRARRSDFRLVAATNRSPETLKHDFLARFATRINVPGLEARAADIPLIARELLVRMAAETPELRSRFFEVGDPRIDPVVIERLLRHRYTHHTRELFHLLRVALVSSPGEYLAATPELNAELERVVTSGVVHPSSGMPVSRPPPSNEDVARALDESAGNVSRAALQLGISRDKLRRLIERHSLKP